MTSIDTITTKMAKRTFIQVETSDAYKTELQKLIGPYMPMANEIKRLLEKEHPSLRAIADKERKGAKAGKPSALDTLLGKKEAK